MNYEEIKNKKYCLHSSYPEIKENKKEDRVVMKLMEIYSGSKSETTSVFQYLYQSFILHPKEKYKEISDALEKIAICEMKHIEIVSQILLSMNVDPKFCKYIDNNQNICNYWSSGNVKYIKNIKEFLDYNIKLEEIAINDYNEIIKHTSSNNIKDIIKLIIEDEYAHIEAFNYLKEDYIKTLNLRIDVINEDTQKLKKYERNDETCVVNLLNVSSNNSTITNTENKSINIPILDLSILNERENIEISDG